MILGFTAIRQTASNRYAWGQAFCFALACAFPFLIASPAAAEVIPKAGASDHRIKWAEYNADDVVFISARFGYATEIRLGDGETPISVVAGDSSALKVSTVTNHIFLKPKVSDARTTNLAIVSSRGRVYNFLVNVVPPDAAKGKEKDDLYFSIAFRYADEAKALSALQSDKDKVKAALTKPVRQIKNPNYFACGDSAVTPDVAFDDGRFTYMRFSGNRKMPAISVANDDGTEQMVNATAEQNSPDTVVVYQLAKRFIFRLDNQVGCLVNKGYDPRGIDTPTGTVSPDVQRAVKGAD